MNLDDIYAKCVLHREPDKVVSEVRMPLAKLFDGQIIECSDFEELREHARVYEEGTWLLTSTVRLTSAITGLRLPREVHTLLVAGDLVADGRLNIGASLIVGATIRCDAFYKNAEVERTFAHAVEAARYVYVQYPGERFVADRVSAPLVFFSNAAWECASIESEVFLPDYMPDKLVSELDTFCRIVGVDRKRFDRWVEANEGDVMEAMTTLLEEGCLPADA